MGGCTLLSSSPLSQGKDEGGCAHPLFLFLVRPLLCPLSIHGCPFPVFLLLRSQVPHLRTPFGLSRQLPDKPESWQPHHLPRTCHHLILRAPARRAHLLLPHLIALCNDCTMQSQHSVIAPPYPLPLPATPCSTASPLRSHLPRPSAPSRRLSDKSTSRQVGKLASWQAPPPSEANPPPPCSPSSCSRARLLIHPALAPLPAARRVLLPRGKPRNHRQRWRPPPPIAAKTSYQTPPPLPLLLCARPLQPPPISGGSPRLCIVHTSSHLRARRHPVSDLTRSSYPAGRPNAAKPPLPAALPPLTPPPQPDSTLQSLHFAMTALCNHPPRSSPPRRNVHTSSHPRPALTHSFLLPHR